MGSLKSLLPFLSKYRTKLLLSVISNVLTALFTLVSIPLVIPFFQILFGADISGYSPSDNFFDLEANLNYYFSRLIAISDRHTALTFICFVLVVIVFFRNLFRYLTSFFLIPVRNGLVRDLRNSLMNAYSALPLTYLKSRSKGDLLSISSTDVVEVEWSVLRLMELLFKSPIIIIGSLIFMFWINMQLSIIALSLIAIIALVLGALSRDLKKKSAITQSLLGRLNAWIDDLLSGMKVVHGFRAEGFFKQHFQDINEDHYRKTNRILWRRDLASPLSEFLGVILVIALIWYGAQLVLSSELRPETFFAFVFAFYNVIEPSKTLSSAYYNVQKGLASMDRINAIIHLPQLEKESIGNVSFDNNWEKIVFSGVSFSFDKKEVLHNLNFEIKRDQTTALVGRSGAGKSTIVDLILGFYNDIQGSITIDQKEVGRFDRSDYLSHFGMVTQEPILFNMTVKDNILMGREFSPEKFDQAIRRARVHDFITRRENGIDTFAGDAGMSFSMGERQRIAIARALYDNPSILIIDESTTSLDAESEQEVLQALNDAMIGKTTIIITHNFHLIKNVDEILVVDNGVIVAKGTHESLLNQPGIYKELLSYQDR